MIPRYMEVSYRELMFGKEARSFWWHCLLQFQNLNKKADDNIIIIYKSDFDKLVENQK
jgi:hypothetical protein